MALNHKDTNIDINQTQAKVLLQSVVIYHAVCLKFIKQSEDAEAKKAAQYMMDLARGQLKELGTEEIIAEFEAVAAALAEADFDTLNRITQSTGAEGIKDKEKAELTSTTATEKDDEGSTPQERTLVKRLRDLGL